MIDRGVIGWNLLAVYFLPRYLGHLFLICKYTCSWYPSNIQSLNNIESLILKILRFEISKSTVL